MRNIAVIKGYWDEEKEVIHNSITTWDTVSEEDFKILKSFCDRDCNYTIVERIENTGEFSITYLIEKEKKRIEEEAIKKAKALAEREKRRLEKLEEEKIKKLKLYEELKKEFE